MLATALVLTWLAHLGQGRRVQATRESEHDISHEKRQNTADYLHTTDTSSSRQLRATIEANSLRSVAALLLASNSPQVGHRELQSTGLRAGTHKTHRDKVLRLRGGLVETLVTEDELDMELEEAGNALVVVDFYADWCGPCKKIAPVIHSLAKKTAKSGRVKFFKVNVDEAKPLAQSKEVKAMPTLLFYRKGKVVKKIVGGDVAGLKRMVAQATMNPVARRLDSLRNEKVLIAAALAYLAMPWQRMLGDA